MVDLEIRLTRNFSNGILKKNKEEENHVIRILYDRYHAIGQFGGAYIRNRRIQGHRTEQTMDVGQGKVIMSVCFCYPGDCF